MSSEYCNAKCCDDEDDVRNDDDWDWDDDPVSPKEEPDCYSCNDAGCRACARHPESCDCADCFEHAVAEYEIWDAPDHPVYAGPFVDEPPF